MLVRFLTPTELKDSRHFAERPEFDILIARIRDHYGDGPLPVGFAALRARVAAVRHAESWIQRLALTRRSTRTGQSHPLGGFTDEAVYEGPLAQFLPYLEAARFAGVVRQTVWGKGEIAFTVLASLRFLGGQAIENRRLCLVEVRRIQALLRRRLAAAAAFATFHELGPPCPRSRDVAISLEVRWR